ncbi:hypothetical protein EYM_00790 [Ignicoccus islandicus DSM 13165]|uniref:Uncharacterized protein n=1 Tax=Ignicoccus islandicus DSM 13165 TaxID=940295 RepID=A0A0U3EA10_9CREN|nr:NrfD/PsrC family molybdoenzyme membrane anchor subunit [Ignicoccus islandicus]ALU12142.1 hypothetical protein EYM_00790 [Ignicoccus islandicus DSM 13165]
MLPAILFFIIGVAAIAVALLKWRELIGIDLVKRNSITWKAMVPAYMFFASVSIGLALVAGSLYLLGIQEPRMVVAAILSLIPAWVLVILDLGRPDHILHMITSFQPRSRIAWNLVFYSLYFLSLLWFLLLPSSISAIASMALGILLESNLAMTMGTSTIEGWRGIGKIGIFWLSAAVLGLSVATAFGVYEPIALGFAVFAYLLINFWEYWLERYPLKLYLYFAVPLVLSLIHPLLAPLAVVGVFIEKMLGAYYPQLQRLQREPYKLYYWKYGSEFADSKESLIIGLNALGWIFFLVTSILI